MDDARITAASEREPLKRFPLKQLSLFLAGLLTLDQLLIWTGVGESDLGDMLSILLRFTIATAGIAAGMMLIDGLVRTGRRKLGFLAYAVAGLGMLLVAGFGDILECTHLSTTITVESIARSQGVIYERIEPPISRSTEFFEIWAANGQRFCVEVRTAPTLANAVVGSTVTLRHALIGRYAYTRWMGFARGQPFFVNSGVLEGS